MPVLCHSLAPFHDGVSGYKTTQRRASTLFKAYPWLQQIILQNKEEEEEEEEKKVEEEAAAAVFHSPEPKGNQS